MAQRWASVAESVQDRSDSNTKSIPHETRLADDRDRFQSMVEADVRFATEIGVTGTPTFTVFNPETEEYGTIIGAQPLERFTEAIERVDGG